MGISYYVFINNGRVHKVENSNHHILKNFSNYYNSKSAIYFLHTKYLPEKNILKILIKKKPIRNIRKSDLEGPTGSVWDEQAKEAQNTI